MTSSSMTMDPFYNTMSDEMIIKTFGQQNYFHICFIFKKIGGIVKDLRVEFYGFLNNANHYIEEEPKTLINTNSKLILKFFLIENGFSKKLSLRTFHFQPY